MRRLLPLFLILVLLAGCAPADNTVDNPEPTPEVTVTPTPTPVPTPTPEPEPITATLTVAGDIMTHSAVIRDAYMEETGEYDFSHMLEYAKPWVEAADLAVANLETTFSGGPNYSGFPDFNSPDSLGQALKNAGFDLLNTTNNHSLDRRYSGLCRTLDVLDELELAHVGTYRTQEEREKNHGIVVADCGGISIAFLAYSYGTNGVPVPDGKEYCINLFNIDYDTDMCTPDTELLEADMAAARELGCDLIAVIMHWGIEYQTSPNRYQKAMAETMVDLGADLVLGGHPHVLQPYEFLTTEAGNTGFVCYSLGNYIANQDFRNTDSTVLLNLELKKDPYTGETTLEQVSYIPFLVLNPGQYFRDYPVIAVDAYAAITEYEDGESELITEAIYKRLQNTLQVCHNILGEDGDFLAPEPAEDAEEPETTQGPEQFSDILQP